MKRSAILLACLMLCASHGWAEQPAQKTIDLNIEASKTRLVIAAFFAAAGKQYAVDPAVIDANTPPLAVKDMPLEPALKWLCKQLDVTCELKSGIYELRPDVSEIHITPMRSAARPGTTRVPTLGMSKPDVIALLGRPATIKGGIAGYEVWTYSNWEIGFRQSRVSRTERPAGSCIRLRLTDAPLPSQSLVDETPQCPSDPFRDGQQMMLNNTYYGYYPSYRTVDSVFGPYTYRWTWREPILKTVAIEIPKPPSQ